MRRSACSETIGHFIAMKHNVHSDMGGTGQVTPPGGVGQTIREVLGHPDILAAALLAGWLAALLVSGAWMITIPACLAYGTWFNMQRFRLPFRLPLGWKGKDYSNRKPGRNAGYAKSAGLLLLGNEYDTNEELWLSNDDARRHAFVLGTTGSGKALPLDALVLAEHGWVEVGHIRAGDRVANANGTMSKVVGVYPQGPRQIVTMHFADGRTARCTTDHLWQVNFVAGSDAEISLPQPGVETRTAADIAIQLGVGRIQHPDRPPLRLFVPLCQPCQGPLDGALLTADHAARHALMGLDRCEFLPSLHGSAEQRFDWLSVFLQHRHEGYPLRFINGMLNIPVLNPTDGFRLRQTLWSLGGIASEHVEGPRRCVRAVFPDQDRIFDFVPKMRAQDCRQGLEIMEVEFLPDTGARDTRTDYARIRNSFACGRRQRSGCGSKKGKLEEAACIRTEADDGLFVMENYLVTHNTELLLGIASQSMMWSSGFLFIDGKGTGEFHGRVWSLVSRFGREDDYRLLNFTNSDGADNSPAGGPVIQSNTLNPFSHGSADQLINLIISLMGGQDSGANFWQHRAMSLVTTAMKALCEMRDAGDVLLDVQSIRDFLPLGTGVKTELLEGQEIASVADIPDAAWSEIYSRGGMIELYLRSLHGEFSNSSRLALKGFFDSLPGFCLHSAINGRPQEGKAAEQHGFLAMQLTKPLGALADDFGHIFRTPFGEVDIEDVVLNRRILVVLLPALQKAPEEMRNCGRIVVAVLKMLMGRTAGSDVVGSKKMLIDARPTNAPSPFIAILDEAGYYMVKGIDTMMAQARSLGFMIILAGQDMAAMQSVSPQIAETAAANARLTAAGATEDAQRTWEFLRKKFATHKVSVSSGRKAISGLLGTRWVDRPDVHFVEESRVRITDLQKLRAGEFYFLMESVLVKARAFYTGEYWASDLAINKFLLVRGPNDRAPGLDQSRDIEFRDGMLAIGHVLLDPDKLRATMRTYPRKSNDILGRSAAIAKFGLEQTKGENEPPDSVICTCMAALLLAAEHECNLN